MQYNEPYKVSNKLIRPYISRPDFSIHELRWSGHEGCDANLCIRILLHILTHEKGGAHDKHDDWPRDIKNNIILIIKSSIYTVRLQNIIVSTTNTVRFTNLTMGLNVRKYHQLRQHHLCIWWLLSVQCSAGAKAGATETP